jgi:hypothetical protein
MKSQSEDADLFKQAEAALKDAELKLLRYRSWIEYLQNALGWVVLVEKLPHYDPTKFLLRFDILLPQTIWEYVQSSPPMAENLERLVLRRLRDVVKAEIEKAKEVK